MSRDDEIAIVCYNGVWYVRQTYCGGWLNALANGIDYLNKEDALEAASNLPQDTEYGIQIYDANDKTVYKAIIQETLTVKPNFLERSQRIAAIFNKLQKEFNPQK